MPRWSVMVATTGAISTALSGCPVSAATSRAMPVRLRQSARFGVSLTVNSVSSNASVARRSEPGVSSDASSSRPPWSSDRPSSRAEHSMPKDSTPRSLAALIVRPGSCAPTLASGTFMPAAAFGAPQTICSGSPPSPASTRQTLSLSAPGCLSALRMRATTTPEKSAAAGVASSTSRPAMVSR